MRLIKGFIILFALIFSSAVVLAQCPINVDFELGSFQNWQCYSGNTTFTTNLNKITVNTTTPLNNIHKIINKGTQLDPYGRFPTSAPDGSNYSVKLGNDGTGAQAERISYLFDVPLNQPEFVITYQYAVVLQDPGHPAAQQPRFTAKVFDITTNSYITCGSFEYVATSSLPGFTRSTQNSTTWYKAWTPVSINLSGYQGHSLRLEFTTADCTQGGHFGYAYIDVNNSCTQLIKGSDICTTQSNFTLIGPAGFDQYKWYNANRTILLGTGSVLTLPTTTADGTTILLDLVPFVGFGCNYTATTVLKKLPPVTFQVTDPPIICAPGFIDLTSATVTQGSDSNLTYTYWTDAALSIALTSPNNVTVGGTYYIKATAPSGCFDIKPVVVTINPLPTLTITNPATVCLATPVNLTLASVTSGSSAGVVYSYWIDAAGTIPLNNPSSVTTAGTYYIKATNGNSCSVVKPVVITYYDLPVLVTNNPTAVCFPETIDITLPSITTGSDNNLTFTYWADRGATIAIPLPNKVTASGIYYIKATNRNGCEQVAGVTVTINPLPVLVINKPADACWPDKVDITSSAVTAGSTNADQLTYWLDANATSVLTRPFAITDSGTYYIKATSLSGCVTIAPVTVNIHKLPIVVITDPRKIYMPNAADITEAAVTTGSTTGLTYTYWNDALATNPITNPKAISQAGTYYIKGTNIYGCYLIKPVVVSISPIAQILVPKAFTPAQTENNKLYPFLIGIKTLNYFKVYNNWGVLVFETKSADPQSGWNGVYKNQLQFLDTFTWYAEGIDYLDKVIRKSGNTLLLK